MGHHVPWVRCHDEHGVGRLLQNRRHDLAKDQSIALKQLQSCLAGLLPDARREHHETAARQVLVFAGLYIQGIRERHGMPDIVRLGGSACRILVH